MIIVRHYSCSQTFIKVCKFSSFIFLYAIFTLLYTRSNIVKRLEQLMDNELLLLLYYIIIIIIILLLLLLFFHIVSRSPVLYVVTFSR